MPPGTLRAVDQSIFQCERSLRRISSRSHLNNRPSDLIVASRVARDPTNVAQSELGLHLAPGVRGQCCPRHVRLDCRWISHKVTGPADGGELRPPAGAAGKGRSRLNDGQPSVAAVVIGLRLRRPEFTPPSVSSTLRLASIEGLHTRLRSGSEPGADLERAIDTPGPGSARSEILRMRACRSLHQCDPLAAYLQQVGFSCCQRLVAKLIDFLCWRSGYLQGLGHIIEDAKVVGGTG